MTTVAHAREKRFAEWEAASVVCGAMSEAETWPGAKLLCWVLMPDHWHGLVHLEDPIRLDRLVGLAKGRSARALIAAQERTGPVWMSGFHDRALRREENLLDAARYVVANPLRSGLVERIADYPYWDSIWVEERRG
nr:transposase [Luteimonas gilva]